MSNGRASNLGCSQPRLAAWAVAWLVCVPACLLEPNPGWDRPGEAESPTTTADVGESGTGDADAGESGGGMQTRYDPVVFACSDVDGPSATASCAAYADGGMSVDSQTEDDKVHHGFIRFDLDDQLAGKTITRVRVRLRTRDRDDAGSMSSGELWACEAFDAQSLESQIPARVGDAPIAPEIGPVGADMNYFMEIEPAAVQANSSLYIRYVPTSNDGLYLNTPEEPGPPKLIIDAQD